MRSLFASLFGRSTPRPARPAPRLRLEGLEARDVPSLAANTFQVPTITSNDQFDAASACSTNGMGVVVWVSRFSDTDTDTDIRAQLYNANGTRRGGEILVATSTRNETQPAVAMDNFGDWKVVWADEVSAGNRNLRVASYNANGNLRRTQFTVAKTSRDEYEPSISVDAGGAFVVAYTVNFTANDPDVLAVRHSDGGKFQSRTVVADFTDVSEGRPSVARSKGADGRFAIAYQTNDDIVLKRYTSAATLVNTHTLASGSRVQATPSVDIDIIGRTVTTWTELIGDDFDILARTVSSTGGVGATITVANTLADEFTPTVAMDTSDGDFVIAWQVGGDLGSGGSVRVREYNANGSPKGASLLAASSGFTPFISIDGNDAYFVTFTVDDFSSADPGEGVYGRFGLLV